MLIEFIVSDELEEYLRFATWEQNNLHAVSKIWTTETIWFLLMSTQRL